MTDHFTDDLRWFMGHQDTDSMPSKFHRRGVWSSPDDGAGSKLGTPAADRKFESWLTMGERVVVNQRERVTCLHTGENPEACRTCMAWDTSGDVPVPIGPTGSRTVVRSYYRWPMRAAMSKARRVPVRQGRPDFARTLAAVARAQGDVDDALSSLARSWPSLGDPATGRAHVATALSRTRRLWREDPPVDTRPSVKSDAQLNAEADATAA